MRQRAAWRSIQSVSMSHMVGTPQVMLTRSPSSNSYSMAGS
jgi:hypothetical protein